ncbi:MAG: hypothetical protein KAI47_23710 [Deltaproteobacteria bacterium]|nr:hypothetical protein [Deltaproteobacteria bacterium]
MNLLSCSRFETLRWLAPALVALLLALGLSACKSDEPTVAELGKLQGPCYPNLTCDRGLVCLSKVCVKLTDGGGDDTAPREEAGSSETSVSDASPDSAVPVCKACVVTVAGMGEAGFADGPALAAKLYSPMGLVLAPDGRLFIADRDNNRVRVLAPDGTLATVAGSGEAGFADGPADQAKLKAPGALAYWEGRLFIADSGNHSIRLVYKGALTTYAGTGSAGNHEDTNRTKVTFQSPRGVARDGWGVLWVADRGNGYLRRIPDGSWSSRIYNLTGIWGIATDSAGAVFFGSETTHRIYRYAGAQVTDVAGADKSGFVDGHFLAARFVAPRGIAVSDDKKIYVADAGNHAVRLIDGTEVSTLAGKGASFAGFADGPLVDARFNTPSDVAVRPDGAVYVADTNNHRIRLIRP